MANRQPLVIDTADAIVQQLQNDDTLFLDTNAVAGAVRLLMLSHDDGGAVNFELRVGDDAARNTLIGVGAGDAVTSGTDNTCVGVDAGGALTTGTRIVCIGPVSGFVLTTQSDNIFVGTQAGQFCRSSSNIGMGFRALEGHATDFTGSVNIGIGHSAGRQLTTGSSNIYIGSPAGGNATTGSFNVGIGPSAGNNLTTGGSNICIGNLSGTGLTTQSGNTFIGAEAGSNSTLGENNAGIGPSALRDTIGGGSNNFAVGSLSLFSADVGSGNFAVGSQAMRDSDLGSANIAVGMQALEGAVVNNGNFAFGDIAGNALQANDNNLFFGANAGRNSDITDDNVGFGTSAFRSVLGGGNFNIAIGQSALLLTTIGDDNVAIGRATGRSLANAIAGQNIFIGLSSGNSGSQKTDAVNTVAIGASTFTTADNQIMLGSTSHTQTILRGTVDVVRNTNACRLNVYNTAAADPPGTSFELAAMRWDTNVAKIGTHKGAGGGTARDFAIETDGTTRLTFGATTGDITYAEGVDEIYGTTTGTMHGAAVTQKQSFWGATPIVQPASANQAAVSLDLDVTGADTVDKAAINANFTAVQTLLNQLRADLVSAGLIKGAA